MKKTIIGADSETKHGEPISFQFFCRSNPRLTSMIFTNSKKSADDFFDYLNTLPKNGDLYIIYGHNLQFDAISFLWSIKKHLLREEVNFTYKNWRVKGVYSNLVYFIFYDTKSHRTVYLVDSFAFFPTSLEKLGQMFAPSLPKLKMPVGLGEKQFKPSDKIFVKYAMRDSEISCYVGEGIDKLHEDYDISQTVSRANMSGVIFRKKYLKQPILMPSKDVMYAALNSYHGGKNGLYERPGFFKKAYGLDIISAYPHAMSKLPSFYDRNLYRELAGTGNPRGYLPEFGIYQVWGNAKACKYPILFDHSFAPVFGRIDGIWTTGFELNEAIRSKEISISKIFGYYYLAEQDKNPSPWKEFVNDFFQIKNTTKDPIIREWAKVILNSLYGKTIELTKLDREAEYGYDVNSGVVVHNDIRRPGPLFHPFIASLITGHTRSVIHRMEHENRAIHTSTDGIFCKNKPVEIPGLGGQKIDFQGPLKIWRNKLYCGYTPQASEGLLDAKTKKPIKSRLFQNYFIKKFALHGFHGTIQTLEDCELQYRKTRDWKKVKYKHTHVNKLRESVRQCLVPNKFEEREAGLNL